MDACHVTENTVRGWLCNSRKPDALAQEALAKEFDCTVDELFPTNEEKED
jgi:transcriptional regulator with XRE-family HTH domain